MIRKASLNDIHTIHSLLQLYGRKGELLARPLSRLYDHLRDFWVFEQDLGCVSFPDCDELALIKKL